MMAHYILDGKTPVAEPNLLTWARWFERAERHVGKTHIGDVFVSTVFLGLDHAFGGGPPVLFETMIFGDDKYANFQERYCTWAEAEAGHAAACAMVRA